MNVKDVMSKEPRAVRVVDRLDQAARILWEQDCGFVPVVDGNHALVGVLTDRDLCMASYTQGRLLSEVPVLASMSKQVQVCRPDDALRTAMQTMQQAQVHRLPVVDARGVLVGVLSVNDLVRAAKARPAAVDGGAVLETLARIGAPRSGQQNPVAASAAPAAKPASAMAEAVVGAAARQKRAGRATGKATGKVASKATSRKRKS